MSFALNEIEAAAKRAARGAGVSWGIGEEAAKATRWLCAQGLDGVAILSGLLAEIDGKSAEELCPQALHGKWSAEGGAMCPLLSGASLSDCAALVSKGPIQLSNVHFPLMLLPFAASVASQLSQVVTLEWEGGQAVCDGMALTLTCTTPLQSHTALATLQLGGVLGEVVAVNTRATPNPAAWEVLNTFAHRTFAPATEASRLAGAGAGLSDND